MEKTVSFIASCMVDDGLRQARETARTNLADIEGRTKCVGVTVVAKFEEGLPASPCTSMAVSPSLEDMPGVEIALMQAASARILSLLVLHIGVKETMARAICAVAQAAELADLAQNGEQG